MRPILDVMRPVRVVLVDGTVLDGWGFSDITNPAWVTVWQQLTDDVPYTTNANYVPTMHALDVCERAGYLRKWVFGSGGVLLWSEGDSVVDVERRGASMVAA